VARDNDFSGIWRCTYWYPSDSRNGEDVSEYYAKIHKKGHELVLESLPNKTDSYMLVHLTVDGNLVTGTWHENTSPQGFFKGMEYSGAMQLIISDDKTRMDGKWVGVGVDRTVEKPRIYTGKWEIVRAGTEDIPAEFA